MSEYAIRRVAFSLTAMLGVITIGVVLLHVSGDPATLLVTQDATRQDMERIRQAYGLDRPLAVQYGRFIARVARGDLGMLVPSRATAIAAASMLDPRRTAATVPNATPSTIATAREARASSNVAPMCPAISSVTGTPWRYE